MLMIGLRLYDISKDILFRDADCFKELLKCIHNEMKTHFDNKDTEKATAMNNLIQTLEEEYEAYIIELNERMLKSLDK